MTQTNKIIKTLLGFDCLTFFLSLCSSLWLILNHNVKNKTHNLSYTEVILKIKNPDWQSLKTKQSSERSKVLSLYSGEFSLNLLQKLSETFPVNPEKFVSILKTFYRGFSSRFPGISLGFLLVKRFRIWSLSWKCAWKNPVKESVMYGSPERTHSCTFLLLSNDWAFV